MKIIMNFIMRYFFLIHILSMNYIILEYLQKLLIFLTFNIQDSIYGRRINKKFLKVIIVFDIKTIFLFLLYSLNYFFLNKEYKCFQYIFSKWKKKFSP